MHARNTRAAAGPAGTAHPPQSPTPGPAAAAVPRRRPWWTPPRQPVIVQVCSSLGTACGVANLAVNFAAALREEGLDVRHAQKVPPAGADMVLVQHEFGLFNTTLLQRALADCDAPKVLMAHSPGVEVFDDCVEGYLAMCPDMVHTSRPVCVFPHPGWHTLQKPPRRELKAQLGYAGYAGVVGTCGFISDGRQFSRIAEALLPWAQRHNWLINLACSRHAKHDRHASYLAEERRLTALAAQHRHLRLDLRMKTAAELNLQLRACDLLWCWTRTGSLPYASGTCADEYCSGTRLVVADKMQHSSLYGLPNVVFTPPNLEGFLKVLRRELEAGDFPRHDGRPLAWRECVRRPADFLRFLAVLQR